MLTPTLNRSKKPLKRNSRGKYTC